MIMREWNTPTREPWNPVIVQLLRAIDLHTRQYFATGDRWHAEQADELRRYVIDLKEWIFKMEGR